MGQSFIWQEARHQQPPGSNSTASEVATSTYLELSESQDLSGSYSMAVLRAKVLANIFKR